MRFVDYVRVNIRSGSGGAGSVAFRREKYVPYGGPAGGDGGKGGSIYLVGDNHLYTLLDLRYQRHHFAVDGYKGQGSNKHGKDGDDILIRVPLGVVVRNSQTNEWIGEVTAVDQKLLVAQGGKGGKGNTRFKTSTNQTPRYAQPGIDGEEKELVIELKLMADVGLVGFPNAGKSTLVSTISAATPKVANYPFTTLVPSLGMVPYHNYQSFVIADIPGIIEGAHEGKGLGLRFLRHIERNAVLLFMIPVTSEDPEAEYRTLLAELILFNADLANKPKLIALSQIDLVPKDEIPELVIDGQRVLPISSVANMGIDELKDVLWVQIEKARHEEAEL